MNQSAVLIFCLIFLTLTGTQGIPLSRTTRCTCIKISDGSVNLKSLEKLEVIPASQSCPRVEIIATLKKNGEKRCLNPESKKIKILLRAISKERSKTSPWTEKDNLCNTDKDRPERDYLCHHFPAHNICKPLLSLDCSSLKRWPTTVTKLAATTPWGRWTVHHPVLAL